MKYMITLFVILISCSNQIAQTIKNMPNGKYSSEGKELTKLELSKLLSTNPIAFDLYNTYLRKKEEI